MSGVSDGAGSPGAASASERPLLEIGWLLAGRLSPDEREAVLRARGLLIERLSVWLPDFEWRMPLVVRPAAVDEAEVAPTRLLDEAATERDARHWDFVLAVTPARLISYETPYSLGMPSRALGAAVISLAYLRPSLGDALRDGGGYARRDGDAADEEAGADALLVEGSARPDPKLLAKRLAALSLHLWGRLVGLGLEGQDGFFMSRIATAAELDARERFSDASLDALRPELREVADLRLEERGDVTRSRVGFYARVLWQNHDDILRSIGQIAPWNFPLRFSRLTIAAVSTLLILSITAESWDLGMAQSPPTIVVFSAFALAASSLYVLRSQRLLPRRPGSRLTEQAVVTRVAMVVSVGLGMVTTYALLFALAFVFGHLLFPPALIESWAGSLSGPPEEVHYLIFSGFVASLGVIIGALGASFEEESYFRHVAYVDEET